MSSPDALFDMPEADQAAQARAVAEQHKEDLSADRRRTLRQHNRIAAGQHPLRAPLPLLTPRDSAKTCGSCIHLVRAAGNTRSWLKCECHGITGGAGSDARAWWPACTEWAAKS